MIAHIEYLKPLRDGVSVDEHFASRAGYLGRIRIPLGLASKLIDWEITVKYAWKRRVDPWALEPDQLDGYDGEPPHYLRVDLAASRGDVFNYFADQWGWESACSALVYMQPISDIDIVWMVADPANSIEDEYAAYEVVERDTPGAVPYWQWDDDPSWWMRDSR